MTSKYDSLLIYPQPLAAPLDVSIHDIRMRSLTFSLAGDLEQAGQSFLSELFRFVAY